MHCHNNSPFVIYSLVLKQTIIINIIFIIACVAGGLARRPPARKLAFSSSPSAGEREILIGSLNVNVNQNLSAN